MNMQVVVEKFWKNFEEASTDEDIRKEFMTEEVLLDLDVKLVHFVETRIEVRNYGKKVKEKYEDIDFLDGIKVMDIIEKSNRKYLDIALV